MSPRRRRGVGLNWGVVLPVIGGALVAEGLGMLICAVVGLFYLDPGVNAFVGPAIIALGLGGAALLGASRRRGGSCGRATASSP